MTVTMYNLVHSESELYLAVLNHLPDAVVVVNQQGQLLFCNAQAQELFQNRPEGLWLTNKTLPYQMLDSHRRPLGTPELPLQRVVAGHHLHDEEVILALADHPNLRWLSVSGGPCPMDNTSAMIAIRDISARKQGEADLLQQALHDELTRLPNRSLFLDQVRQALVRAQDQPDVSLAILFIDLDRFKAVNDNLGHQVGNQLLAQLGDRLRTCIRAGDTAARLGGDEFAILLDNIADASSVTAIAQKLRDVISDPFHLPPHDVYIDASIGIAMGPASYLYAEDWLRDADTAMYQVKEAPDRHWQVFDGSLQEQHEQRMQIEAALRQALIQGELRLHYQPIVNISTRETIGFEALVRWQHPEQGLLMPGDFIAIAETSGLIIPLGWWVLQEACRQLQVWTALYPAIEPFKISVNMSSKQFSQKNLASKTLEILAKTGLNPTRLKIEITEGVLIDHSESIISTLQQLRAVGIGLSIDDFGTGYSSLSYLHQFPFDCLKIDRSFIENADQDFEKLEILQSVVRLAWNLGLEVVAEGIETERHYAQLKALRCEAGQGYLFSRPLAPEAVEAMLEENLGSPTGADPSPA